MLACMSVLTEVALGQVTGNVLSRVFQIKVGGYTGTAFVVDYQGSHYFVTAQHMVAPVGDEAKIDLRAAEDSKWRSDSDWHTFNFKVLHGTSPCADVAVLVPLEPKSIDAAPLPSDYDYAMGQEAYFLGYPFGLFTDFGGKPFSIPIIKHAYVSATVGCGAIYPGQSNKDQLILLDGINNHGFSGGPVVAPNAYALLGALREQSVVGVISAYKYEDLPISIDGKNNPRESGSANSGIIIAIPISQALSLIKTYKAALDEQAPPRKTKQLDQHAEDSTGTKTLRNPK